MRKPEAASRRISVKKVLLDCPTLVLYSRQMKNLKELRNITANYFCVHCKNRRKHNQHFELLFFMINLHLGKFTHDKFKLSTYRKTSLLLINTILSYLL